MYVMRRVGKILRGLVYRHGTERLRKRLWNWDYDHGCYGYGNSAGDFLYPFLRKHTHNGSILDLGCGEGKTANELDQEVYSKCVGVDISDVAIAKAKARTERRGRVGKNVFYCSDFGSFAPSQKFDVILFRDSIYYLPPNKIRTTLDRYAAFLKEDGCFVVRLCEGTSRHSRIVEAIEATFDVADKRISEGAAVVLAFRPVRKG
jgi:SAM-dependent methyltransferase